MVWINHALTEMHGGTVGDFLGKPRRPALKVAEDVRTKIQEESRLRADEGDRGRRPASLSRR
jgi:hypothetical protein